MLGWHPSLPAAQGARSPAERTHAAVPGRWQAVTRQATRRTLRTLGTESGGAGRLDLAAGRGAPRTSGARAVGWAAPCPLQPRAHGTSQSAGRPSWPCAHALPYDCTSVPFGPGPRLAFGLTLPPLGLGVLRGPPVTALTSLCCHSWGADPSPGRNRKLQGKERPISSCTESPGTPRGNERRQGQV